ncbi:MAG: kelch repeat-containing protein [Gammaproteobacteria bacterium]
MARFALASGLFVAISAGFLSLAGCGGSSISSGSTPPPQTIIQAVAISSSPSPAELKQARIAYRQGEIIEVDGGGIDRINGLFGINVPHLTPAEGSAATPGRLQAIAFRAAPDGALHSFQYYASALATSAPPTRAALTDWETRAALTDWETREVEDGNQLFGSGPPAGAWIELQTHSSSQQDKYGSSAFDTISIYRLNTNNTANDYYLYVQQPQEHPNYHATGCHYLEDCGWYADTRSLLIGGIGNLWQYKPNATISSSTAGFSIGGGLSGSTPTGDASYSESWSQPAVTTTDETVPSQQTAQWLESFTGQGIPALEPPDTSTGSFYSVDAAIFQMPSDIPSFAGPTLQATTMWQFQNADGTTDFSSAEVGGRIATVNAPVLTVSTNALRISPGEAGARTIKINAEIPDSTQGLNWAISNIPTWLNASVSSGSGPATVTLTVVPGTPQGTVGTLNIDTNPSNGAPSVITGPLTVNLTVVAPFYGVLITGGDVADGGNTLQTAEVYEPSTQGFTTTIGEMVSPRASQTETPFPDGKVLIAGGDTLSDGYSPTVTAELFDPSSGSFTATGSMSVARSDAAAVLLPSGLVLVAGGESFGSDNSQIVTASADLYNSATGSFTPTGDMTAARFQTTATLLADGRVLIAGGVGDDGTPLSSAEIYDPDTGVFTALSDMTTARAGAAAARLPNGEVLIAGGYSSTQYLSSAELFNPATGKFTATGSMANAASGLTATALGDGEVLVTGGFNASNEALSSAELYDPDSAAFGATLAPMSTPRAGQTATLMTFGPQKGEVLIAGGTDNNGNELASAELFDPTSGYFTLVNSMSTPRTAAGAGELQ